ncbi:ATP-dependent Clp protease ATP-binding subunit ClpX, partial [Phenoliferia sp. Uapishka_3]
MLRSINRLRYRPTLQYRSISSTSPPSPLPRAQSSALSNQSTASIGLGGSGRNGGYLRATSATGNGAGGIDLTQLSPRQLSAHLDEFVVGQERAKKVLAVAVYNHYARLKHLIASRTQSSPPNLPTLAESTAQDPYLSSFSSRAPHVAKVHPRDRSSDPHPPPKPPATSPPTSFITLQEAASTAPAFDFTPSYKPPESFTDSLTSTTKRRRTSSSTTPALPSTALEPDPTIYDSSSASHPPSRRSPTSHSRKHSPIPRGPLNPNEEILSDFVGQVPGSVFVEEEPMRESDPDALVYEKSNVLLLGPTGSGKSLLARTLARTLDVPFVGVEATGMTMAGYVGEDVESCVHRLLQASDWDAERASTGIIFIDEVDKLSRSSSASYSKDVSGEGVQQALLKILEGTIVSVPDKEGVGSSGGSGGSGRRLKGAREFDRCRIPVGPGGVGKLIAFAGMKSERGSSRGHHQHSLHPLRSFVRPSLFFTLPPVKSSLLPDAFPLRSVGLEKTITSRLTKGSIGFGASIKPAPLSSLATKGSGFFTSTKAAEELSPLDLVEPSDLVAFGFIPEFIGRLPVVATLKALTEADLLRVLTEPKNALVRQYEELFRTSGVECRFTTPALREVAKLAVTKGTGARGLRRIMENVLLESMFIAPGSSIRYVLIDREVVLGQKEANFYSRGQQHIFLSDFEAEEGVEADVAEEGAEDVEGDVVEKKRATG